MPGRAVAAALCLQTHDISNPSRHRAKLIAERRQALTWRRRSWRLRGHQSQVHVNLLMRACMLALVSEVDSTQVEHGVLSLSHWQSPALEQPDSQQELAGLALFLQARSVSEPSRD